MGAERDPAGPTGSGLSGTGYGSGETRDGSTSYTAPMSGTDSIGDRTGTGEVHSGLHSSRSGSEDLSSLGFAEGGPASGVRERVMERARSVADTVRDSAGTLGHRASEVATQTRDRLSAMSDRTNQALENRGLLTRLQENPLPALGVAFGLGFLLAGGGRSETDSAGGRLRRELRGALMAGLTAGAAQTMRGFLQSAGRSDGPLGGLFGGGEGTTSGSGSTTRRGSGGTRGTGGRMSSGLATDTEGRPPSHREEL